MFYKLSVLAVMLAIGAASLRADDKDKKDAKKDSKELKGKVVKFDKDKKSLKLKTADGEKEFATGDELLIVLATGQKFKTSLKNDEAGQRYKALLGVVFKDGNEVGLILSEKDNVVKEVHYNNRPAAGNPAAKPPGVKPATVPPATKPGAKNDAQK
jgi:hypothetical protein